MTFRARDTQQKCGGTRIPGPPDTHTHGPRSTQEEKQEPVSPIVVLNSSACSHCARISLCFFLLQGVRLAFLFWLLLCAHHHPPGGVGGYFHDVTPGLEPPARERRLTKRICARRQTGACRNLLAAGATTARMTALYSTSCASHSYISRAVTKKEV